MYRFVIALLLLLFLMALVAGPIVNYEHNKHRAEFVIIETPEMVAQRLALEAQRNRQLTCLARNIYHEARGEGESGMRAVATVTLNRSKSYEFPHDLCDVVFQKFHKKCQFSWYCDKRIGQIVDTNSWNSSIRIARESMDGKTIDILDDVVYYHSTKVKPHWNKRFVVQIGNHKFYKEKV